MQLWTLSGFENREDDHAYERAHELRESGEKVQYAEIDPCGLARRAVVGRGVIEIAVEVVEPEHG